MSIVISFISFDGLLSATSDNLFSTESFRISWLTLQEVVADSVAEEVIEAGEVAGVPVVGDARMKRKNGE